MADADGGVMIKQIKENQFKTQTTSIQSNLVEFDLSYNFSVPGETHKISFTVVLPQTIPERQNILSIKYSPKPSRIFKENANRYAEFVFLNPDRKANIEINIKAELFRYDLLTAKKKRQIEYPEDLQLDDFLKSEKHIEKDNNLIQELAEDIEGETEIDIVKNIYDFVIDNLEYVILGKKDQGALRTLELGKGDCTEYSDLFVAICRAKSIPARVSSGYTIGADPASSKHNWAEVYLQEYGWVPFDPAKGDIENAAFRNIAFSRMRPIYIYLSHTRNDEILGNYNFGAYNFWGDRPKFENSIHFKQPALPFQKNN